MRLFHKKLCGVVCQRTVNNSLNQHGKSLQLIGLSLIAIFLFVITSSAQSRTISKHEYEKAFEIAVSETNQAYPVIFKVTTHFIENGKTFHTVTDLIENESPLHRRIKRTNVAGGRKTNKYQVSVGFDKVFCSDDGVSWKPSKHECYGPVSIYGGRDAESIKYSVTVKSVKGKGSRFIVSIQCLLHRKGVRVRKKIFARRSQQSIPADSFGLS